MKTHSSKIKLFLTAILIIAIGITTNLMLTTYSMAVVHRMECENDVCKFNIGNYVCTDHSNVIGAEEGYNCDSEFFGCDMEEC